MLDMTKYLDGRYLEGGRVWPEIDCYGIVLEVRRDLGLPDWPDWAGVTKAEDGLHHAGAKQAREAELCEPQEGAVAACYSGSLLTHVAVVVERDGLLYAVECNPRRNVTCLPLRRFERRFVRVEYYR
ncbi:hypothetical protein [Stutzerimonas stutzeri]|uniref:Nitrite transporter n=1 Tax=Stutzerimonas stutzeri KOS6 TaxID=1218352 RepID=A0A061JL35_STUST|nr:hypothetical protein [Stutzerimonas stutzeri]EWC39050.1 nitrite transporter [Stutzerimonas stutzeri KOS6]